MAALFVSLSLRNCYSYDQLQSAKKGDSLMHPIDTLSLSEARRHALAGQSFGRNKSVQPKQLHRVLRRLGALQIDSVNALVRSHYLPLYSRLGPYERADLDLLATGVGNDRGLFEYWGHEASLLPLEFYPLFRWRMQRARDGHGIYRQLMEFGRDQQPLIRQIHQKVEQRGPLSAGELTQRETPAGSWWDWSAEKLALEWLFASGELTVSRGNRFERLYDLPERVLPESVLRYPAMPEAEAHRQLLLHAAHALGVATENDLRDYFRMGTAETRLRLTELVEEGHLHNVQVHGWNKPAWMVSTRQNVRLREPTALLSPFDSLIWARERTERVFGFHYRLEFYIPSVKRMYGYYVMPFLYRGKLIGRVDLRAERAMRRLAVHAIHEEERGISDAAIAELAIHLQSLARWLGLELIQLNCRRPAAKRLLAAGLLTS